MPNATMPPSEALYRNLKNAHAVLLNNGLGYADADAVLRESFCAFYAGLALETADPRAHVAAVAASLAHYLDNLGLSAATRLPRGRRGLFGLFRRVA